MNRYTRCCLSWPGLPAGPSHVFWPLLLPVLGTRRPREVLASPQALAQEVFKKDTGNPREVSGGGGLGEGEDWFIGNVAKVKVQLRISSTIQSQGIKRDKRIQETPTVQHVLALIL